MHDGKDRSFLSVIWTVPSRLEQLSHAPAPDQGSLLVGAATSCHDVCCEALCSLLEHVNAAATCLILLQHRPALAARGCCRPEKCVQPLECVIPSKASLARCWSEHSSSAECRAHWGKANTGGWLLLAEGTLPQGAIGCFSDMGCSYSKAEYELTHQPGTASLHPGLHRSVSASCRAAVLPAAHCHISD